MANHGNPMGFERIRNTAVKGIARVEAERFPMRLGILALSLVETSLAGAKAVSHRSERERGSLKQNGGGPPVDQTR
jgi:hypothetical protein